MENLSPDLSPDLSSMTSSELGRYGGALEEQTRGLGVNHVLVARVLREARSKGRHKEEQLATFEEWTMRYFDFNEERALRRMKIHYFPTAPLLGKKVTWHELEAACGAKEPVLTPLLEQAEGLLPTQITRVKEAGARWMLAGLDPEAVATLVARTAKGELAVPPRRRAEAAALPSGKLGRRQVLAPLQRAQRGVAILLERSQGGEVFGGTWPQEVKEALRALLRQVSNLFGEDPQAFAEGLLAERRAAPREAEERTFPGGENAEKASVDAGLKEESAELERASEDAGGAGDGDAGAEVAVSAELAADAGPAIVDVVRQVPEVQRMWLGERLFSLLRGDPIEGVAASLQTMYEPFCLRQAVVSREGFERWLSTLCRVGGDNADPGRRWDAVFSFFEAAELPGFREQLYLLRTYPLADDQRARVLALCQAVALYPRQEDESASTAEHPLATELVEIGRDMDDLRRLLAEVDGAWSEEAPMSNDVQCLLFEEQMELEKAVNDLRNLGQERAALGRG